jgi:hypothetical protein
MNIYKIPTPNKIVNSQIFNEETGCYAYIEHDEWYVAGANSQEHAESLIAEHSFTPTEPTVAEKLASVGLSVTDLKKALGL